MRVSVYIYLYTKTHTQKFFTALILIVIRMIQMCIHVSHVFNICTFLKMSINLLTLTTFLKVFLFVIIDPNVIDPYIIKINLGCSFSAKCINISASYDRE